MPEAAFPIVGIGASAGGLEAVTQFLQALPAEPGATFILVQHLDPTRESMLANLLSRVTSMPVRQIQDGTRVEPTQLYVTPSHADVAIASRMLRLIPRSQPHGLHMPIDRLFRSLAEDQGPNAIGVVLSGSGSDGTLGLQAIKEAGGFCMVQDERTAAFTGMPHSAITHGYVDVIDTPTRLAQELMRVLRHPYVATPVTDEETSAHVLTDQEAWSRILRILHRATGVNFLAYKPSTMRRRVARRMALQNIDHLGAYAQGLEAHKSEVEALYQDLLIKVTTFFRIPDSFEALKRDVLPRLIQDSPVGRPLRIWVPGCATGEEVYSIAICIIEALGKAAAQHPIRLFGTDIDELALMKARTGLYIENIALDVSPERLRRFFVKDNQYYQVKPMVRELCIFAKHNLFQDPPFSNLDLISCRNVLIYLEAATQQRVVPLLHYALRPNGVLTLGPSETIGSFTDLFTLTDPKHKFYTKKVTTMAATGPFFHGMNVGERGGRQADSLPEANALRSTFDLYREADHVLLAQYVPAAVLVTAEMEILQFRGDTDRYLKPPSGKATLNLFRMARDGLLSDLRAALEQTQRTGIQVRRSGARFETERGWQEVTIRVLPLVLPPISGPHYLVVFEDSTDPAPGLDQQAARPLPGPAPLAEEERISRIQQELEATRLYLQSLMEQYEAANEELNAANEEIISSNEELQSTNEELEAAKEELQSMNEELLTTNDELWHRNRELSQANNDLTNLFSSIHLPIIIVGQDLNIRSFTTMAETVLNLIPSDIGRPIGHLQVSGTIPDLESWILQVIDTNTPEAREVRDREGHWYILRIRPYRTLDHQIDGAVLLFVDIDSLKDVDRLTRLLEVVKAGKDYAEGIVQTVPAPLLILDGAMRITMANEAFYRSFQLSVEETEQRLLYELDQGQWDTPRLRELLGQILLQPGEVRNFEVTVRFASIGVRTLRLNCRRFAQTDPSEALILLVIEDVTELTQTHDRLRSALEEKDLLLRELHHRVKNNLQLVSSLLSLQADSVDPVVQHALAESQRRIHSIALVHEQLSLSSSLAAIDMRTFIRRLASGLFELYGPDGRIGLNLHVEEASVDLDSAVPCALILTELLSNALQHAFPEGRRGEVSITWRVEADGHLLLRVQDTGIGIPPEAEFPSAESLGFTLVQSLASQLGGHIEVDREVGTTVSLRFPSGQERKRT